VRPIWDVVDSRQYKAALKLCTALPVLLITSNAITNLAMDCGIIELAVPPAPLAPARCSTKCHIEAVANRLFLWQRHRDLLHEELLRRCFDCWLISGSEYAPVILSSSGFEPACSFLDGYLAPRTFLVGYSLTIADIVVVVLEVCPCDALIHHVVLSFFRE
jgi:hypothetical protein